MNLFYQSTVYDHTPEFLKKRFGKQLHDFPKECRSCNDVDLCAVDHDLGECPYKEGICP
jgi:hypothetical protein